jgi:Domain of Unknown Function (DUF1080)
MKTCCAVLFVTCALLVSFSSPPSKSRSLFNGKNLMGWESYLGPPFDTVLHKFHGTAPGLNNDQNRVFSVVKVDGKGALRISGEHFGGISTLENFRNYHLRLRFKWGSTKWAPKKENARDSGLLYHAVGPHAGDGSFWMRSQEFQIQEGDCGDYWGVGGGIADIHAKPRTEKEYVYDPSGPLLTFGEKSHVGRHCIKNPDGEKTSGQWNVVDLYCLGDTSVHIVNGVVTMILFNLRLQKEGEMIPLKEGKIQIQSEGAEVFYRDISIEPIRSIPTSILEFTP